MLQGREASLQKAVSDFREFPLKKNEELLCRATKLYMISLTFLDVDDLSVTPGITSHVSLSSQFTKLTRHSQRSTAFFVSL
jgi:hypothetical protein